VEGDKADPWNHTHAAMAMLLADLREEADAAYRFLVDTQAENGGWAMERRDDRVVDHSQDTNQAAYIATGAWFHFLATGDRRFLEALWATVERAIELSSTCKRTAARSLGFEAPPARCGVPHCSRARARFTGASSVPSASPPSSIVTGPLERSTRASR